MEEERIKEEILKTLTELDKFSKLSEIVECNEKLKDVSIQKISFLLNELLKAEKIMKIVDKKMAYFKIR